MTHSQPHQLINDIDLPTTTSFSNTTFLIDAHCRICLESGPGLMQPCSCRGTVRYVH
jgi:E3 ubiquitin-protein ligase DOA10